MVNCNPIRCIGRVALSSETQNQLRAVANIGIMLAALFVVGFTLTHPVFAKGPIHKVTVSGHWVTEPIEIIDVESLATLEPWPSGLIAWGRGSIADPPKVTIIYQVSFHLDAGGMIYTLRYAPDQSGGSGYVYVPGRGDPEYSHNIGRIGLRENYARNPDGEWYYASDDWESLMQKTLSSSENSSTSEAGASGEKENTIWVLTLGTLLLLGGAAVSIRISRRRRRT